MNDRAATNHAGRVGPSLRRSVRGRIVGARLRRAATASRSRRRRAVVEAADGQFSRLHCGCGTFCSRRRTACVARGRRQEARRNDEGSRHRTGHGVLVGQPRRVLSRRRVVASLPAGRRGGAAGDRRLAGHRRFVLPGACVAGRVCRPLPLSDSGPADVQRRGDLRRFLGDCPAARIAGISDPLVGDSASPPARRERRGGRASRRIPGAGRAGRAGEIGAWPRQAGAGRIRRTAVGRQTARGRESRGRTEVRRLLARAAAIVFHRRSVPAAGARNADRRDACNPLLFGS